MPASHAANITPDQLSSITHAGYFYNIASATRALFDADQVQALDTSKINIAYLTSTQREDLTPSQVGDLSATTLRYVPASQVEHVTTTQLASVTNAGHIRNISSAARAEFDADQINAISDAVWPGVASYFSAAQQALRS